VVGSFVLAGGVLTGKYDHRESGRATAEVDDPRLLPTRDARRRLRALAVHGTSPAALAIAFALANPAVVAVLFGATSPDQVAEHTHALELDAATVSQLVNG